MDNAPQYVIEMLHITKEFNGVKANDDITLQLKKGEIHALLGENGAGKSTLMSILFGMLQPEAGTIKKNGQEVHIASPNDATALHIGMVHQHFKLIDVFSVLDNIILGAEDTRMGFLQKKEARRKVKALSEQYGLKVDLDAKVESITVGMQQRVEILKMLYRDNEVLIFDEPTAVLTPQEIEELMHIMRGLAAEGKSILFISHKLSEIMEVSDRVTVLRKGRYIGTVNTCDTNKEELSRMIVGRDVKLKVDKGDSHPGEPVLKVSDMHVADLQHRLARMRIALVHLQLYVAAHYHAGQLFLIGVAGIDRADVPALAQHGHAVGYLHYFAQLMRYEQYALALGGQPTHYVHQFLNLLRSKHCGGLVKYQHLVIAIQHFEYLDALLHTDGNAFDLGVQIDL